MTPIDLLITKHGYALQCWYDRYGRGVWALIGPVSAHLDVIRDTTEGGDAESVSIGEYFGDAGAWLPVVTASTWTAAIQALDQKLSGVPEDQLGRDTEWGDAVFRAFERVVEIGPGNLGLNDDARDDEALRAPQVA
ncbi:hypothetical protein [Paraburkholderia sp. MM6662-R1]|uniref:hypothetical protein n=1 Tax=Paraburkholderia sp. MM6662-R1 TaxID=2991066 RepID=UPI003D1B7793